MAVVIGIVSGLKNLNVAYTHHRVTKEFVLCLPTIIEVIHGNWCTKRQGKIVQVQAFSQRLYVLFAALFLILQRIHATQHITQHTIGHFLLIIIVEVEEIANGVPELAQSGSDLLKDALGV